MSMRTETNQTLDADKSVGKSLMDEHLVELEKRRQSLALGGGTARIEKQHEAGKLTARERIDALLDPESFQEQYGFAQHRCSQFGMENKELPADGVVTGCGTVGGRLVHLASQDFTVAGGAAGEVHCDKIVEMMHAANREANPKFAHTLAGTIADERRHVGFGENRIGSLIREHPERKADVEKLQREMSYWMLATFGTQIRQGPGPEEVRRRLAARGMASAAGAAAWQGVRLGEAKPEELEAALGGTILKEFKVRLERVGIEYQTPLAP